MLLHTSPLREEALQALTAELTTAADCRVSELGKEHETALATLRAQSDAATALALSEEKARGLEALSAAREEAQREATALRASHAETLEELKAQMASIEAELRNAEAV